MCCMMQEIVCDPTIKGCITIQPRKINVTFSFLFPDCAGQCWVIFHSCTAFPQAPTSAAKRKVSSYPFANLQKGRIYQYLMQSREVFWPLYQPVSGMHRASANQGNAWEETQAWCISQSNFTLRVSYKQSLVFHLHAFIWWMLCSVHVLCFPLKYVSSSCPSGAVLD